MSPTDAPIVVLDSGLGGLTVARAIRATLPHEDILYFGDTARVPYGSKTAATVTSFVRQILVYFRSYAPKHVVVACNTATALALPTIRMEFPELSISGVIDPGAKAAVIAGGSKETPLIGIIGTEATIKSKAYERSIHRRRAMARLLLRPTPLLVPLVEEARAENDALVKLALQQYLHPLIARGPDVVILGCTHYTLLKPQVTRMFGDNVAIIDSSRHCAEDVARRLQVANVLSGGGLGGSLKCIVTDDSPRFRTLAARFLGEEPEPPALVTPEALYAMPMTRLRRSA